MLNKKLLFLSFFITITNVSFAMEQSTSCSKSGVVIRFNDDQKRVMDEKYVNYIPTLKCMLEDTNSIDKKEVFLPGWIKPAMWDKVVVSAVRALEEIRNLPRDEDFNRMKSGKRGYNIGGIMNTFMNQYNDKAIMESANIFDFLGMDEVLDYKIFHRICTFHELKATPENSNRLIGPPANFKLLELLNPGLAQRIHATKPKPENKTSNGTNSFWSPRTLAAGYKWHELPA